MSKKQTYFGKHREALQANGKQKLPVVVADDATRMMYEEGKAILIDKGMHWTSFDIVRKIRNILKIKKVGHAGTLDPLATGLLIVCTGKYTKQINTYMAQEKEYTGAITLGATTPTYDLESNPEDFKDVSAITNEDIYACAKHFVGEISQMPPVFSAIKKDGVALYELARRGEEVDLKPRKITIKEFEITEIAMPVVHFRVVCSTGTYIRSLAHDFGASLGCGGYLSSLRRTKIGYFDVGDAITIEEFTNSFLPKN